MDPTHEQRLRDLVGQHFSVARMRLSDHDLTTLGRLIENWSKYAGRVRSYTTDGHGWGSDGKYTRVVETTITFLKDRVGIQVDHAYTIDGASQGTTTEVYDTARKILNLLRQRPGMLNDPQ
jgi:hypothetical protein